MSASSSLFIYLPLVPPLLFSVTPGDAGAGEFTLAWYVEMWRNPVLTRAIVTSLEVGLIVAVVAPLLGLAASMAIRELGVPRLILAARAAAALHPRRELGTGHGAVLSVRLGIPPSLLTIAIVQIGLGAAVRNAGHPDRDVDLRSRLSRGGIDERRRTGWRAFLDIELPLIRPGIFGAATFSLILSFNETIRTSMVQGGYNTVQTYIWATYKQIGLSPALYALMSLLIVLTLALVVAFLVAGARGSRTA